MAITSHERVGKALEILKQPGPGLVISIGDKLDEDYVVVGRLGGGGFGEVFPRP